jgi:hypothetical protein
LLSTFNTQYKEINKVTEILYFNNTIKVILLDYASSFFVTAADIEANLFDVSIRRTILNDENCTMAIHWIPKIMFSRFTVGVVLRICIYVFIFLLDRIQQRQLFFSYDYIVYSRTHWTIAPEATRFPGCFRYSMVS